MIKFAKKGEDVPVYVYGSGNGWVDRQGKERRYTHIYISSLETNSSVGIEAKDFDALVEACRKAIVEADKAADSDIAVSRKHFETRTKSE